VSGSHAVGATVAALVKTAPTAAAQTPTATAIKTGVVTAYSVVASIAAKKK
jgi:hypothetical protein